MIPVREAGGESPRERAKTRELFPGLPVGAGDGGEASSVGWTPKTPREAGRRPDKG